MWGMPRAPQIVSAPARRDRAVRYPLDEWSIDQTSPDDNRWLACRQGTEDDVRAGHAQYSCTHDSFRRYCLRWLRQEGYYLVYRAMIEDGEQVGLLIARGRPRPREHLR